MWTTPCIMGAFCRLWSVAWSLQGVDVRIIWPGKGPVSVGLTPGSWYVRKSKSHPYFLSEAAQ